MLKDTTTTVDVSGMGLARHEAVLLDQMTAALDPCKVCGNDDQYLTFWTPNRTVAYIVCPTCGSTFWAAPEFR